MPNSKLQPNGTLLKALGRAWRWQQLLDEGVYATVGEIGDAENMLATRQNQIEADLPLGARVPTGDPNRAQRSRPGRGTGRIALLSSFVLAGALSTSG